MPDSQHTHGSELSCNDVTCQKLMQIIFQKYAKDIEQVQQHFESCKRSPKLPRNAPSVAGRILWARQLLMRIELPMKEYVVSHILPKSQAHKILYCQPLILT